MPTVNDGRHSSLRNGFAGRRMRVARRIWNGGSLEDDFDRIEELLKLRSKTLASGMESLKSANPALFEKDPDLLFRLATTDLFVEKAQAVLTARACRMSRAGIIASLAAIVSLVWLAIFIGVHAGRTPANLSRNDLILRIVSAISLGAIVLVAVKYLISLARSFFHESVTLLARRHALRFGRLYVYLNSTDVSLVSLREAFDWNHGGDSSFLDMKPSDIAQTPYSALAKILPDVIARVDSERAQRRKKRGGLTDTAVQLNNGVRP